MVLIKSASKTTLTRKKPSEKLGPITARKIFGVCLTINGFGFKQSHECEISKSWDFNFWIVVSALCTIRVMVMIITAELCFLLHFLSPLLFPPISFRTFTVGNLGYVYNGLEIGSSFMFWLWACLEMIFDCLTYKSCYW